MIRKGVRPIHVELVPDVIVTIKGLPTMSQDRAKDIASWLNIVARTIRSKRYRSEFAPTARFKSFPQVGKP